MVSFLCEILCFGAIIYTNLLQSDKVKDIAASTDWLDNIHYCLKKMNPETRTLRQVTIDSAAEADHIFSMLMGDDVPPRREFIERHAKYANIDA